MVEKSDECGERDTKDLRELEDSRKTIEEATQVIVMVKDDTEKTPLLTSDVEALKKNQELLVNCISQNLGYVEGKPVAACLIHWSSFEIEETKISDLIVETIASAIEYAGSAWDEFKAYQVIHEKPKTNSIEVTFVVQVLSVQQLYRIITMYRDDTMHNVSSDVVANMRVMITEDSNDSASTPFLLNDDSSIPFTVEDMSKSVQQVDVNDIEPPQLIRQNSGFGFLLTRKEGSTS